MDEASARAEITGAGSESRGGVFRSVVVVLAGLVATAALSIGTDMLLRAAGIFPPLDQASLYTSRLLLLATAYRSLYAVAGSYVAASLARHHPMGHAIAVGVVGLGMSIAGVIVAWGVGPAWYGLALVVLALPCAWVGGRLQRGRVARDRG